MILSKHTVSFYVLLEVSREAFFTLPGQNIIETFLKLSNIGLCKIFRSDYLQFCSAIVEFFILGSQLPFNFMHFPGFS